MPMYFMALAPLPSPNRVGTPLDPAKNRAKTCTEPRYRNNRARVSKSCNSLARSAYSTSAASGRAMTIISHPGCAFHSLRRMASRRRRFTRLRRTAEPTRLLTEKPTRVGGRGGSGVSGIAPSVGRRAYARMSHWPCCRFPRRRTRWKSCDERRRDSLRNRSLPVVRAMRPSCSTSRDLKSTSRHTISSRSCQTHKMRLARCGGETAQPRDTARRIPRDRMRATSPKRR